MINRIVLVFILLVALPQTGSAEPDPQRRSLRNEQGIARVVSLGHLLLHEPTIPTPWGPGQALLDRPPRQGCKKFAPVTSRLGGTVGGELGILLSRTNCGRPGPPRGSMSCTWEIVPEERDPSCRCAADPAAACETAQRSSGNASIDRPIDPIAIPMPKSVGQYRLSLNCGGRTLLDQAPLFVTFGPPMTWVRPPEPQWTEKAACWGEGLQADQTEQEALTALQEGLYRYGKSTWRYGYGRLTEDGEEMVFPVGGQELRVPFREEDVLDPDPEECCQCNWKALVEDEPNCNFSDCFVFSEALQGIAGVFGIGGLVPIVHYGDYGVGFLTRPGAYSPDLSEFSQIGNLRCEDGVEPCGSYIFGAHSLRQRDGRYFDATFNSVYEDYDEAITHEILYDADGTVLAQRGESIFEVEQIASEYGRWWHGKIGLQAEDEKLGAAHRIRILGAEIEAAKVDTETGRSRRLEVEVELEVEEAGNYLIRGYLCSKARPEDETTMTESLCGGAQLISQRPRRDTSDFSTATIHVTPEQQGQEATFRAQLSFSGEDLYSFGVDGPWEVRLYAGEANHFQDTPAFRHEQFGELPATVTFPDTLTAFDLSGDGLAEHFGMEIEVDVRRPGGYAVELRLHRPGTTLAYSNLLLHLTGLLPDISKPADGYLQLSRGQSILAALLPASDAKDLQGDDFRVTAVLFDENHRAVAGWTSDSMKINKDFLLSLKQSFRSLHPDS